MKKLLLITVFITFQLAQAQIVNIPDANFKNALLNHTPRIDTNNDGEIQVTEAEAYTGEILVWGKNISDLTGILRFKNITTLNCSYNNLSTLNLYRNSYLKKLICGGNQLTNLDVSNNNQLTDLDVRENQLTNLDLSNNNQLTSLYIYSNQLTNLDVSNNSQLTGLYARDNQLTSIDVSNNNQLTSIDVSNNNQLTSIDVSNNNQLRELYCRNNQLTSIDVSNNNQLTYLIVNNNQLTNIDVSNNGQLTNLDVNNNQLTNIDVSNNSHLFILSCDNNQLTNIDVSNNSHLELLFCNNNQLTSLYLPSNNNSPFRYLDCRNNQLINLDLSNYNRLAKLKCGNNSLLEDINLRNGNNDHFEGIDPSSEGWIDPSNFENLPNLQTVCVDAINTELTAFITTQAAHSVTFTENCSFMPSQSNTINGTVYLDLDQNGCNANDIPLNNVMITSNNGTNSYGTYVLSDASYTIYTTAGDFTTSLNANIPNYFTVSPNTQTNTFTGFGNTFTADFCVTPNQIVNDVSISLIPVTQAVPGFNARYQIVYKNNGTTPLNGSVTLDFDGVKLNFLNASTAVDVQTTNSLTFNYQDLNIFETRTINLEFQVLPPTTVNIGDVLSFTTTINPISGDYTTDDNTFNLKQIVVSSYDPNDITCLEGGEVLFADANKYLHYIIRFQNTGTASAINIVVKNILTDYLDAATLQIESISHTNRVAITNGNEIEFIFENINLPDSTTNEVGSHGFITYKIKPKSTISVGNMVQNVADIFFDYNAAIQTNVAQTTIVNTLGVADESLLDFSIYPNPAKNNSVRIKSKTPIKSIKIYNILGKKITQNTHKNHIDISTIAQGLYFVKVKDVDGKLGMKKMIKK